MSVRREATVKLAAGHRLYGAQRFREAEGLFRSLIAEPGLAFDANIALGTALSRREKWREAEQALSKALLLRPDSETAAFLLARALGAQGRSPQGAKVLRVVVERAPFNMAARLELGRLSLGMGQRNQAYRVFSDAMRLAPENIEPYLERIPLLLKRGDFDRAFGDAEKALALGLRTEEQIEKLTFPFGEQGRPPWSKADVRRCERELACYARAKPGVFWARFYLTGMRLHLDHEGAFEHLPALSRQATGRYAWARWLIGLCFMRRHFWKEASAELAPILKTYPFFLRVGFLIGEALLGLGNGARALKFLARLEPDEGPARGVWLSWMGEIHFRLRDFPRALSYLDQACSRGDELPLAICWRGGAKLGLGRGEEALRDLDRAVERVPIDGEPYFLRAHANLTLGRYAQACADIGRFLAVFPDDPDLTALHSLLRWQLGQSPRPKRWFALHKEITLRWPQMRGLLTSPSPDRGAPDADLLRTIAQCVLAQRFTHYFHPDQLLFGAPKIDA